MQLGNPESGWKDLAPGVRVQFAEIGIKMVRAARIACGVALKDGDVIEASDALSREMLRRGIVAWEGIEDAAGQPIMPATLVPVFVNGEQVFREEDDAPIMQPAVELFIADPDLFEKAEQLYVHPWLTRDREKNGSGASSIGTSVAETGAPGTAKRSATPDVKADASRTPKRTKKAARTSSTSRTRTKANSSSK